MSVKRFLKWEEIDVRWEDLDQVWEDISVIEEFGRLVRGSGGSPGFLDYVKGNPWDKARQEIGDEKTKKFLRILCRVNGIDYEKESDSKGDVRVTVEQLDRVFNESRIDVKIGI